MRRPFHRRASAGGMALRIALTVFRIMECSEF
jgi:hypothetical protein